jgi:CHAD domain-containing protein
VLESGSHVDRSSAEEMHELRIRCKKLRYATEFFQALFPDMSIFIGHMKGLQDLLGVMNDIAVMEHILDELLGDDPATEIAMYAGGLVGWRTRQFFEIKDSFGERWEELVGAKHPWWK